MPRSKKGAATSRGSKGTRGGKGYRGGKNGQTALHGKGRVNAGLSFIPFMNDTAGFTLADEARQTSQHDHSFGENLRRKPVAFVSAGTSEPLKVLDLLLEESERGRTEKSTRETPPDSPKSDPSLRKEFECARSNDNKRDKENDFIGPEQLQTEIQDNDFAEKPPFFFDLKGDQTQEKPIKNPVHIPERPSSRGSSSSDEVILFKGRDAHRKTQPTSQINMAQIRAEIQVMEQQIVTGQDTATYTHERQVKPNKKNAKQKRKTRSRSDEDEDAILADYIANMQENGDAYDVPSNISGNYRDLGGEDYFIPDESSSGNSSDGPRDADKAEDGDELDTDLSEDDDGSESEIDDETLAKLITGCDPGASKKLRVVSQSADSSSSADDGDDQQNANTHDEFDFMDWERPSLRRKKGKGAKARINFNVSDSELEQTLQAAWKNDRLKKSERKKEREQLRALGMLGKKTNPDDLRVKYPDGMSMEQVAEEFRSFLLGSDDSLVLPPMDNHARKMIHELANKLKIKSKSTGKADQRRPALYRTVRTLPYVESTFDQTINRISRRYFPRLDMKGKRSQRAPQSRANHTAATYRDGEIIGAAAPELGTENRGRAMLEKMGWSSGTALGSLNNKGILQPVTQTMKRSKAGLG